MEFMLYIDHKLAATEYRAMKAKDLAKAVIEADAIFDPETMYLVQIMKKRREREKCRAVLCAETGNRCFGRTVWEDLESGDLAVICSMPTGDVLVDLVTFTEKIRRIERCSI